MVAIQKVNAWASRFTAARKSLPVTSSFASAARASMPELMSAAVGTTRLLPRLASFALVGVAIALTYSQLDFTLNTKIRPEWRQIAEHLNENRGSEDRLLLYKGFAEPVLGYYLRGPDQFEAVNSLDQLKQILSAEPEATTWLLLVHSNERETSEAKEIFLGHGRSEAARAFGWGASGLTLLRSTPNRS